VGWVCDLIDIVNAFPSTSHELLEKYVTEVCGRDGAGWFRQRCEENLFVLEGGDVEQSLVLCPGCGTPPGDTVSPQLFSGVFDWCMAEVGEDGFYGQVRGFAWIRCGLQMMRY